MIQLRVRADVRADYSALGQYCCHIEMQNTQLHKLHTLCTLFLADIYGYGPVHGWIFALHIQYEFVYYLHILI